MSYQNPQNPEGGRCRRDTLIIHPASDEVARSWPQSACRELIKWVLQNSNFNIIEFGLTPVLDGGDRVKLIRKTLPLSHQAGLMAEGSIFIGVDSGFAHLANAYAVPSLLLIGEYHQFSTHLPWRLRTHDIVLRAAGQVNILSKSEVREKLIELVKELELERVLVQTALN